MAWYNVIDSFPDWGKWQRVICCHFLLLAYNTCRSRNRGNNSGKTGIAAGFLDKGTKQRVLPTFARFHYPFTAIHAEAVKSAVNALKMRTAA